jgi:putative redox protein
MRAISTRAGALRQTVQIRQHRLYADEPEQLGGSDSGPRPEEMLAASLASCSAITMEMYATRKGWNVDGVEVVCDYEPADRGHPTRFLLALRFPSTLSDEQVDRLRVIAAKCPVHRTLDGEVMFEEHVERVTVTG